MIIYSKKYKYLSLVLKTLKGNEECNAFNCPRYNNCSNVIFIEPEKNNKKGYVCLYPYSRFSDYETKQLCILEDECQIVC